MSAKNPLTILVIALVVALTLMLVFILSPLLFSLRGSESAGIGAVAVGVGETLLIGFVLLALVILAAAFWYLRRPRLK